MILNAGEVVEHGKIGDLRTARHRGHEIRLDGPPDTLIAQLSATGIAHEWRAPVLRVELDDPAVILRAAAQARVTVRQIAPIELNLDEVFASALARRKAASQDSEEASPVA